MIQRRSLGSRTRFLALLALLVAAPVAAQSGGPELVIDAPPDLSWYRGTVTIEGTLRGAPADGVRVSWTVLGTGHSGVVDRDAAGRFSFSFDPPVDRAGLFVKIRAEGASGLLAWDSRALIRAPVVVVIELTGDSDGITGRIQDPEGQVVRLEWVLDGTLRRGELAPAGDGSFAIPLDPRSLGPGTVRVIAWLHGGWSEEEPLVIAGPEAPIPVMEAPPVAEAPPATAPEPASPPAAAQTTAPEPEAVVATPPAPEPAPEPPAAEPAPAADSASVSVPAPAQEAEPSTAPGAGAGAEAAPTPEPVTVVAAAVPTPEAEPPADPAPTVAAAPAVATITSAAAAVVDPTTITVTLASPVDGSSYGADIAVRGAATPGTEIRVSINPTIIRPESVPFRGVVTADAGGLYELVVSTSAFRGDQRVEVAASSGPAKAAAVILAGGGAIAGVEVAGDDSVLTATWPPVPLAVRYDVTLQTSGRVERYGGVRSPFRATGLVNGELYTLRLDASLSDGRTLTSDPVDAIPLSADTLRPVATGEYRRVRLVWPKAGGAEAYEIWRTVEGVPEEKPLARISASTYVDTEVAYGRVYTYSIAALPGGLRSAPAAARTVAFPTQRFTLESTLEVGGAVAALTVDRNYAYLACGPAGLVIVEVRDPAHPTVISRVALPDARDVELATLEDGRRYAVVTDGERGLVLVDISVPVAPVVEGSRVTTNPGDLAIVSNREHRLAYVADGESGIKVVDISAPRRPERVATVQTGDARSLYLRLPYLYVAGEAGLTVLELGNPVSPVLVSQTSIPGARVVTGDARGGVLYLYVAGGEGGLTVLDAADPRRPRLAGVYPQTDARAIAVSRYAFLAESTGFRVLDMTDPTRPELFDTVPGSQHTAIALEDRIDGESYVYTSGPRGLDIHQVLVDGRSLEMGSYPTGDRGYTVSLARPGTRVPWAAVADHARGVHLIRLDAMGTPEFATERVRVPTTYAYDATLVQLPQGWHLAVADAEGGLKLFDLTRLEGNDPAARARAVGSAFAADARAVTALPGAGGILLVADSREGLRVLDATRAEAIRQVALLPRSGLYDVAATRTPGGRTLGLLAAADGITVVDLSNPATPVTRGRIATGAAASRGVSVAGSRGVAVVDAGTPVFAVLTSTGVLLLDVGNPDAPRVVSSYATSFGEDLYASESGDRIYLAEGHLGLTVLDVSNPAQPRKVSSFPDTYTVGAAEWLGVPGHVYAYLVDTARLWQVEVLVPGWLTPEPDAD